MKRTNHFVRVVTTLIGKTVKIVSRFFDAHSQMIVFCCFLCALPFAIEYLPQCVCLMHAPEKLTVRIPESQINALYAKIPQQTLRAIDNFFLEGSAPSKYAAVTMYLLMYHVYGLLKHNRGSEILRKAFSRSDLYELRAISQAYGTKFEHVCTKKFMDMVLTERCAKYISNKMLGEMRAELNDISVVKSRPWLCILRRMKMILSLKYHSHDACEFILDILRSKGAVLMREDNMYGSEHNEDCKGEELTKSNQSGFVMQKLDQKSIFLLKNIVNICTLVSKQQQKQ